MNRLAIIDWGIGGISIYRLIKERLGDIGVVYLSDTGVTPYGKMKRTELVDRLDSAIAYLKGLGVTHLVIGCNAASTAIPLLDDQGVEIVGVIEPAIKLTASLKPKKLGVIGGGRTILSGVYREGFAKGGIAVSQRIAQPLSGLIESGDVNSEKLRLACRRILKPLKNCSHILLACTHYPAITAVLSDYVSPQTKFVDPALSLVEKVSKWDLSGNKTDLILTTGDAKMMAAAANAAFGVRLPKINEVSF